MSEVKSAIEQMSATAPTRSSQVSSEPSGIPADLVPRVMVTAISGVVGGLTMAVGGALAAFAILSESPESGQFWGWMGGAFGCFFGGGGALIGAINSYRQISGVTDLLAAVGWNWLDRLLIAHALLGSAFIAAGLALRLLAPPAKYSLLLLGAIVIGQSALFWILRWPYRRRSHAAVRDPTC